MSLYIVATPIGNLSDITFRAVEILSNVDCILAEDTRVSKVLCQKYSINTPLQSFHSHTSDTRTDRIIEELKQGKSMALISDAGTPGISDPAFAIIKRAIEAGVEVTPIPGASAFLTALMAAGVMTHHFTYFGFPPLKKGRKTLFESFASIPHTIVLYESCHRVVKTLNEIAPHIGGRSVVIGRELTKTFEEFVRGDIQSVTDHVSKKKPKGEFVILIDAK